MVSPAASGLRRDRSRSRAGRWWRCPRGSETRHRARPSGAGLRAASPCLPVSPRNRGCPGAWPAQQFRQMPLEIGLHMAIALRLAAEGRARMDPGVVVDLHERFERDTKLPAVMKHGIVVVG